MATLTLKNVPQELYDRLKARAAANRRSLNQEAISSLEREVTSSPDDELTKEREAAWERMRANGIWITEDQVAAIVRAGRDR